MNLAINLLNIKFVFKYCGFNRVWLIYNHTLLNPQYLCIMIGIYWNKSLIMNAIIHYYGFVLILLFNYSMHDKL